MNTPIPPETEAEGISCPVLSDKDVYEAMKSVSGYLDITPEDFKEIYQRAYQHAVERLRKSVTAARIMTRAVVFVSRSTPLAETAAIMARNRVSGVPVTEGDGSVVGMISEKDFLVRLGMGEDATFMEVLARCLSSGKCPTASIQGEKAGDIMSAPVISVSEDATLADLAQILTEKGINRVPVLDTKGRLSGIVSRADLVRAMKAEGL